MITLEQKRALPWQQRPDALVFEMLGDYEAGKATTADMRAAVDLVLEDRSIDWNGWAFEHDMLLRVYANYTDQQWEDLRAHLLTWGQQ